MKTRTSMMLRLTSIVTLLLISLTAANAQSKIEPKLNLFWDDREPNSKMRVDNSRWQAILDKYLVVKSGDKSRFRYNLVSSSDVTSLKLYIDYLQSLEPRQFNTKEQKAYWVNLYNATALMLVLQNNEPEFPLEKFSDIKTGLFSSKPWDIKALKVVFQEMSLNDIAHTVLRPIWQDPRVLYVINTVCVSCPSLPSQALNSENIDDILEQAAKDFVNRPDNIIKMRAGELVLPSLYDWYQADFGGNFGGVVKHIQKYATPELSQQLSQFSEAEYDYDWTLDRP